MNAIAPGVVDTPQARQQLWAEEGVRRTLLGNVPLGRFGREADVTSACAYLVSDWSDSSRVRC